MRKNIIHRNLIGHWKRVATATLQWKVILILFICTFAFTKNAHAYDDLRNTLDYMFAKIDRNAVPTGYLIDYAIEYENLDKYSGRENTSTMQCDIVTYAKIVKTMSSSSLGKTSFHKFKNSLYNAPKNNKADSKCRLSIIFQDYAQLKANSLNTGAITYENGQVYLHRQDAFQIKKLCAACIIDNAKENNDITFTLPKELILSNESSISDVQIDCGNGLQSLINYEPGHIKLPNIAVRMNGSAIEGSGSYGLIGGEQYINVPTALQFESDDEIRRFFLHAFCNAAGMFNEQQRKDRDDYVTINLNNVKSNCKSAFTKITQNYTMQGSFDYSSITLAASTDYSNGSGNTIMKTGNFSIAKTYTLSYNDIYFLNGRYLPYIARTDNYIELDDTYYPNGQKLTEAERLQLQTQLNSQRGLYGEPPLSGRAILVEW